MFTLFLLLYVYGGDDYLVNLKVVSKTTKCSDFSMIFPIFQKCTVILPIFYRDFLTALLISNDKGIVIHSLVTFFKKARHFNQRAHLETGEKALSLRFMFVFLFIEGHQ